LLDALHVAELVADDRTSRIVGAFALPPSGNAVMKGTARLTQRLTIPKHLRHKLETCVTATGAEPAPSATEPSATEPSATEPAAAEVAAAEPAPTEPTAAEVAAAERAPTEPVKPGVQRVVSQPALDTSVENVTSSYWTWRVMQAGFTLKQCCAIRQLDEAAVLDHLIQAAERGHRTEPARILSQRECALVDELFPDAMRLDTQHPPGKLPRALDARRVQLYLLSRRGVVTRM